MAAAWIVPFLAGTVAAIFAARVWGQWVVQKRASNLAWALGLSLYALAALLESLAAARGWTFATYATYLVAASANVGAMGAGTLYLARGRRAVAHVFAFFVVVAALVVLAAPFLAPPEFAGAGTDLGLDGLGPGGPHLAGRIAFIALSALGGVALIGGALWSSWQTRRLGVLLIGLGALVVASGGSIAALAARAPAQALAQAPTTDIRLATQAIGIFVMFIGYLRGRDALPPAQARAPANG
ncbi:MAG TPA: hypothetical protein VM370_12940 [Candidatus Thermoplasmatota archaeon]|nr:hypothetical protein [Candidatus Thermoplasmatota archaeon]